MLKKKKMGQPFKGSEAFREEIKSRVRKVDKQRGIREAKAQGKSLARLIREFFLDGLARLEKKRKG